MSRRDDPPWPVVEPFQDPRRLWYCVQLELTHLQVGLQVNHNILDAQETSNISSCRIPTDEDLSVTIEEKED